MPALAPSIDHTARLRPPLRLLLVGHLLYWAFVSCTIILLNALDPKLDRVESLLATLSWSIPGCLVTAAMAWRAWRSRILELPLRRRFWRLARLCVLGYVGFLLALIVVSAVRAPSQPQPALTALQIAGFLGFIWLVQLGWVWLGLVAHYVFKTAGAQRSAEHARALAVEARLAMLRHQINPHFLFNALNSIVARIAEDPPSAQTMVRKLAELLRHAVGSDDHDQTVEAEMERVRLYLDLEGARYEHDLRVGFEIDDEARDLAIPPFLLQPLAENAVKHGMQTTRLPLTVRVRVRREERDFVVVISNSGSLVPRAATARSTGGVGLINVKERLIARYGTRQTFDLLEGDGWVHARLRVREAWSA